MLYFMIRIAGEIEVKIIFSVSVKNCIGSLVETVLNLLIAFGKIAVCPALMLPVLVFGSFVHLLESSSVP